MNDENEMPPTPDMSKLVPDGWEHVTTGDPKLGDAVLWRGEWQSLRVLGGRLWEYQMVIRRKPPQKKVRPLNAEEWRDVIGCIRSDVVRPVEGYSAEHAYCYASNKLTCHPPGNSKDVRKLYVEEMA